MIDRDIRIAGELVRIARELVAADDAEISEDEKMTIQEIVRKIRSNPKELADFVRDNRTTQVRKLGITTTTKVPELLEKIVGQMQNY